MAFLKVLGKWFDQSTGTWLTDEQYAARNAAPATSAPVPAPTPTVAPTTTPTAAAPASTASTTAAPTTVPTSVPPVLSGYADAVNATSPANIDALKAAIAMPVQDGAGAGFMSLLNQKTAIANAGYAEVGIPGKHVDGGGYILGNWGVSNNAELAQYLLSNGAVDTSGNKLTLDQIQKGIDGTGVKAYLPKDVAVAMPKGVPAQPGVGVGGYDTESSVKGLGGFGLVLGIALAASGLPAGLSTAFGGGVAGGAAAGAVLGGGTAALTGGDVLKGALAGGLMGGMSGSSAFNEGVSSVASDISTATGGAVSEKVATGALTGAAKAGVGAVATGNDVGRAILGGGLSGGLMNSEAAQEVKSGIASAMGIDGTHPVTIPADPREAGSVDQTVPLVDHPIALNAVNTGVNTAITAAGSTVVSGGSFGDVLKNASIAGIAGGLGAAAYGTVYEASSGVTPEQRPAQVSSADPIPVSDAEPTPTNSQGTYFNTNLSGTLAGAAGGAVAGGTSAALSGGNVSNAIATGGIVGAASGLAQDAGASTGVVQAAGQIGGAVASEVLSPSTPTPTPTPTPQPATREPSPLGLSFGDVVNLSFQRAPRRDMNWGSRLATP